jgi:hypothetical protein
MNTNQKTKNSLKTLLADATGPKVSIFTQTHLHAPQNAGDKTAAENLIKTAKTDLAAKYQADEIAVIVAQLDEVLDGIDWNHTQHGLALHISNSITQVHSLAHQPTARVVIADHFALSDLVRETTAHPSINLLLLSELPTRLFHGTADQLAEIISDEFPMVHEGPGGLEGLPTDFGQQTSIVRDENHKKFFRKVEQALRAHLKLHSAPLFVFGVERYLAFWQEVAPQIALAGTKSGNYDDLTISELGKLVTPVVGEYFDSTDDLVIAELDTAVSQKKLAVVTEITEMAANGQVAKLVLGYGNANQLPAVEDIVWLTLLNGGDVVVLPIEKLKNFGEVSAIVRY